MPEAIPDLWRFKEDARLYELYLCRLEMNGLHERVVSACRQIRRHANRGPGPAAGAFTFFFEIESLCKLKDYRAAWRQLRLSERSRFGKRLDLSRRRWPASEAEFVLTDYAPLRFFMRRYRQGCALLERALALAFVHKPVRSYDLLPRIFNTDKVPANRQRVTLSHFYNRLGNSLRDWRYWQPFVAGFHPRLLRLAGVRREELLAEPAHLATLYDKVSELLTERITATVGGGQTDVIESAAKVRKRQQALQRKLRDFARQMKPLHERTDRKLRDLFGELPG